MRPVTPQQATEKIRRYCAWQERSHAEVRNKLFEYGLYGSQVDEIITALITEGFLNEERFAKAFAGGKFRMKKWGRIKIIHALESKGVSTNCIKIALKEIESEVYLTTLRRLLEEKLAALAADDNPFKVREKLSAYVLQKGYEPELVWKEINDLIPVSR